MITQNFTVARWTVLCLLALVGLTAHLYGQQQDSDHKPSKTKTVSPAEYDKVCKERDAARKDLKELKEEKEKLKEQISEKEKEITRLRGIESQYDALFKATGGADAVQRSFASKDEEIRVLEDDKKALQETLSTEREAAQQKEAAWAQERAALESNRQGRFFSILLPLLFVLGFFFLILKLHATQRLLLEKLKKLEGHNSSAPQEPVAGIETFQRSITTLRGQLEAAIGVLADQQQMILRELRAKREVGVPIEVKAQTKGVAHRLYADAIGASKNFTFVGAESGNTRMFVLEVANAGANEAYFDLNRDSDQLRNWLSEAREFFPNSKEVCVISGSAGNPPKCETTKKGRAVKDGGTWRVTSPLHLQLS